MVELVRGPNVCLFFPLAWLQVYSEIFIRHLTLWLLSKTGFFFFIFFVLIVAVYMLSEIIISVIFFSLIHIFLWKDWRKTVDATLKKSVVHFSLIFWLSRFHLSQLIQFIGCDVCIHYHEGKKEKERMSEVVHMSSAFM